MRTKWEVTRPRPRSQRHKPDITVTARLGSATTVATFPATMPVGDVVLALESDLLAAAMRSGEFTPEPDTQET